MKLLNWLLLFILIFAIVALLLLEGHNSKCEKVFKYKITYNTAHNTLKDFTNEYEFVNSNTIRYKNEIGDSIFRSGTFSIKINNEFGSLEK
jgi:hypothetical protein